MQSHLNSEIVFGIQSQIDRYDYGLQILVAGATPYGAHIYGISDPGTSQCYDSINFHAIGSGTPHALNSLISRDCYGVKPLRETLIAVYEAKRLAEKAPGVGLVTDIEIVRSTGITRIPREEIKKLEPICEKWIRHDTTWESEMQEFLAGKEGGA